MKLYIFLFIICFSLINESNQNNLKKKERLENGIKFILSLMRGNLKTTSYSFKYNKYIIELQNFQILNLIYLNNINFLHETNIINVNNIKLTFMININIKFFSNKEIIITDNSFLIETIYNEIKFKVIDDFNIQFLSCNINNINIPENNIMTGLEFFSEFNNKNNHIFNNTENMFNDIFTIRIKEIEKKTNLLYYDMMLIINNCTKIFDYNKDNIDTFQIDNIITNDNYIELNREENTIKITNLTIFGKFYFDVNEVNFNFTCKNSQNHIIYDNNKYIQIIINNGCELNDDCELRIYYDIYDEQIEKIIEFYQNELNINADYYYKNIL